MHILPNISQSKGNQTSKFGQVIEYNNRIIFLQKSCRRWGKEISSRPHFFKKKALYEVKANDLQLSFNHFSIVLNLAKTIKTKYIKL